MNNKELIDVLSNRTELSQENVKTLFKSTVDVFQQNLSDGQTIGIQGFGTFEIKRKEEQVSFNPLTKKRMFMPPKITVIFRPSNILKDKIKSIK
ncbi:MAG: HU family DNA-binding protein [Paludibacter sp.]|nr:HU family DNA-binding protein [Paludibacter sp.]